MPKLFNEFLSFLFLILKKALLYTMLHKKHKNYSLRNVKKKIVEKQLHL